MQNESGLSNFKETSHFFNPERSLEATTELAKFGIAANSDNSKSGLLRYKKDLRLGAEMIHDRAQKLLSEGKHSDVERLIKVQETIAHTINRMDILIDNATREEDINSKGAAGSRSSAGAFKVLTKNQEFPADHNARSSFGFGQFIKAMVAGTDRQDIRAALSEGTDSAGGYTVPTYLMRDVIDAMRSKTVVVQAGAVTIPLETQKTHIARLASDPQSSWRMENGAVADSDPTFDSVTFEARSLACLVKVSRELLEDSLNLDAALMNAFSQSMARQIDLAALFGSGTAPEPRGLFSTTGVNKVSMGTNGAALTSWAKVLDAMLELQVSNAEQPSAMIMAPRTWRTIEGFVDTTGQPLRAPSSIESVPRMVTTQVPVDQEHGTATAATPIIIGDFSQMMLGIRTGLRIEVLREAYASNMQYAFLAHLRFDVQFAQPKAFAVLEGIVPA